MLFSLEDFPVAHMPRRRAVNRDLQATGVAIHLARDFGLPVDEYIACADAIAGKRAPTEYF
jgi:hypothetical protein